MKNLIDQNKVTHESFIREVLEMARDRNINVAIVTDLRMGCSSVGSDNYFVEKCYNAIVTVAEEIKKNEKLSRAYSSCDI